MYTTSRCLNVSGVVQVIAKSVFYFFPQARTYIHLFEECTQNWFALASIIEHTLTMLNAANTTHSRGIFKERQCRMLPLCLSNLVTSYHWRACRHYDKEI